MGGESKKAAVIQSELYSPRFDSSWEPHTLYELADWVNGMSFRNINFSDKGKPVIKIAEIKNGITGQTKFTDKEYDPIYHITKGDMLFSWSGQPDTSIDVFRWRGPDGWLNQHIFKVFPKEEVIESYFFYLLKYLNPNFVRIAHNKQTTGLGHVTKKDLQRLQVSLPPEDEQRAIAHILGTLDDKIELNRRMNETLEAMARAVFKSWFVDFDPVRARAEGRDTGLPKEVADLFPDSFEDSDLGEIPKGWGMENIGDIIELAYGKALKETVRQPGNIPVYGSNGQVGWHNEPLVNGPGIVVGRKGNPGIVTWVSKDFFSIDTTFYVVPKGAIHSMHYIYHALKQQDLPSLGADSAVPGLNRNMAYMNKMIVPPENLLPLFDEQMDALTAKVNANEEQSRTIAAIRDALLPKLISGEIRVRDLEKFVETSV